MPDGVVTVVGEPQGVVGRHVDPVGAMEDALAPRAQEVALAVEDHHRVRAAVEGVDAILRVDPDRGHVGVELAAGRHLRPRVVDLVAIGAAAEDDRRHAGTPARASKIARGLRTIICSIWSSSTPAFRSAGRMSSGM